VLNANCSHPPHRKFTRLPHLAGTEQNLRYAEQIGEEWLEFGLDSVELVPYDVLLSYPNQSQPNYISIVDRFGGEVTAHRRTSRPPVSPPRPVSSFQPRET